MSGYGIALQYINLHEVKDNAKLAQFMKKYKVSINPATTPWCAAFINACERASGNPGNGKLNARSFLTYGRKVTSKDVRKGDIVIFSRGGSTWQGHVAYFDGFENKGRIIRTLGGNQSDKVCIGWYDARRLLGFRRYES